MNEVIITLGLPCAGKTTLIEEQFSKYAKISADDIKETHPDYDPDNTAPIHEWSVEVAKVELFNTIKSGIDIVFDSGSINNKYSITIMKEIRNRYPDYSVSLIWVRTPYQVCLERNAKRTRKVPAYAITDKAIKEVAQFNILSEYADIVHIFSYFTNKHIFCDMDGVLAAQTTLPIINGEVDFVNGQIHRWQLPVAPVIDQLNLLEGYGSKIYILSATPNSFSSNEKKEWLKEHYSMPEENIFFVNQGKHKAEMLENLVRMLKIDKKDVLMIDDTHSILYQVKDRGMNAMHVSEFLTYQPDLYE